ncbi:MAG: formate/nitrite transporter family protein [Deltaproteobacteria bacterium]|nr:formate/nitrite transporter family protein [Deltaproteobacteria bacterium]
MADVLAIDAYSPAEIAQRVEDIGVKKARMSAANTLALAVMAGAFIGFGATFFAVIITGSTLGFGITRLFGALGFCLGLVLVVIAGAELFTGNNLLTMAWASRKVSTLQLLRNWLLVYVGNFVGSLAVAWAIALSGIAKLNAGAVGQTLDSIAVAKVSESFTEALVRGVLCNALVCLAVWLCFAARSVTDKVLAVLLPVSAFVTCGFEHSVANMFFLPVAMLTGGAASLTIDKLLIANLLPVTLGNIVGGALMVGGIYWFVFLRAKVQG